MACKRLESACVEIEGSIGAVSECDGYRHCGELRVDLPSVPLLQLYFFTRAGLVLIVGVTFVFSGRNLELLRGKLRDCIAHAPSQKDDSGKKMSSREVELKSSNPLYTASHSDV